MKLKKLLPIASVASVAAVVAPIVTSCGNYSFSYTFSIDKDGKLSEKYTPDFEPHAKVEHAKAADIEKDYFNALSENKNMFAKEFIYATQKQYQQNDTELISRNIDVTVKMGSFKVNKDKKTMSFNVFYSYVITEKQKNKQEGYLEENIETTDSTVAKLSVVNLPFCLSSQMGNYYFTIDESVATTTNEWSIKLSMDSERVTKTTTSCGEDISTRSGKGSTKANQQSTNEEKETVISQIVEYVSIPAARSWYLKDVSFQQ